MNPFHKERNIKITSFWGERSLWWRTGPPNGLLSGGQHTTGFTFAFFCPGLVTVRSSCDYFSSDRTIQKINMGQKKHRITREEALSFLLTYIVVEQNQNLVLDQLALFDLTNLALRAVEETTDKEGIIPHELIESLAKEYLDSL